jgi:protein gp37
MGDHTAIEWTDATWNPVRGCAIVSKGCTNCYAMRQAHRSSGAGGAYEGLTKRSKGGPVWTGKVRLVPELLEQPLHWRRPRRIFVNSMSDLFHEDVPLDFIAKVFEVMNEAHWHIYQVLTKRAQRAREVLSRREWPWAVTVDKLPQPNVWLGVSVEDQAAADERIPQLLATPAAVRWISAEPLLGPVKLKWSWVSGGRPLDGGPMVNMLEPWAAPQATPKLDWVVAGGESGPGARPMHPAWAQSLRDQCAAAGVPFFFKQWGNWAPCLDSGGHVASDQEKLLDGTWLLKVGKKSAGRELDGRTHDEYPA